MRHIDLLNLFLAMRFAQPDYPNCLRRYGYSVHLIGVTFVLPDGRLVAADVVTGRRDIGVTLLVEVKGGRNFDHDQLGRMLSVTPADLRDVAHLPVDAIGSHRVQVLYVCDAQHRDAFAAIEHERVSVLSVGAAGFTLLGSPLPDDELVQCLEDARILPGGVPLAIIPFDAVSTDEEVARVIIPHIVEAMVQGVDVVTPEGIVAKTHSLVRGQMVSIGSRSELSSLTSKVAAILRDLGTVELRDLLERVPGKPIWRIVRSLPTDGNRTRELMRFRGAVDRYLERLGSTTGVQLELLDGLEE